MVRQHNRDENDHESNIYEASIIASSGKFDNDRVGDDHINRNLGNINMKILFISGKNDSKYLE